MSAPPGSGKTVLFRSWIAESGLAGRVAWVPQPGGCDPERFWIAVAGALRDTAAGSAPVRSLTAAPDLDGWTVVERLLADLASLEDRVWLVIDDLHEPLSHAEARVPGPPPISSRGTAPAPRHAVAHLLLRISNPHFRARFARFVHRFEILSRREAGVSRVSVGGAFAFAALGALVDAATELRDKGTYGYLATSATGMRAVQRAVEDLSHGKPRSKPGASLAWYACVFAGPAGPPGGRG